MYVIKRDVHKSCKLITVLERRHQFSLFIKVAEIIYHYHIFPVLNEDLNDSTKLFYTLNVR